MNLFITNFCSIVIVVVGLTNTESHRYNIHEAQNTHYDYPLMYLQRTHASQACEQNADIV